MSANAENVLKEALSLSALDRAKLVEELLTSLDQPDEAIDAAWRKEIESRLAAHESGKMGRISLEEVMAKYRKP